MPQTSAEKEVVAKSNGSFTVLEKVSRPLVSSLLPACETRPNGIEMLGFSTTDRVVEAVGDSTEMLVTVVLETVTSGTTDAKRATDLGAPFSMSLPVAKSPTSPWKRPIASETELP